MTETNTAHTCEWLSEELMPEWDAFVASSPEGNPFSLSIWLKAFRAACVNGSTRVLVVRGKNGEILAGVALCIAQNRLGQSRVITSGLHQYSSFIFAAPKTKERSKIANARLEMSDLIAQTIEVAGFESVRLINHYAFQDIRSLMWRGWQVKPAYTFRIDLSAFSGIESFSPAQRNKCRKAKEGGLVIREHSDLSGVQDLLLRLLSKTFTRQGLNLDSLDQYLGGIGAYRKYFEALGGFDCIKCFEARHPDGNTAAIRVGVLGTNSTYYDWLAGNDPAYHKFGSSSFLISGILEKLKDDGVQKFDFGGANTPRIADFKQSFNGELICGYETYWASQSPEHVVARFLGLLSHKMRTTAQAWHSKSP